MGDVRERVLREVERARDEIVEFTRDLVRIPTVNPPGERYTECAHAIGDRLARCGFAICLPAGRGAARAHRRPPQGQRGRGAWRGDPGSRRPSQRALRRGATRDRLDRRPVRRRATGWPHLRSRQLRHEGGIAAAVYAAEAVRRAGVRLAGTVEVGGTVDEESGGFAGVAWLAERAASREREPIS